MKFDIIMYISDACKSYLQGDRNKTYALSNIKMALDDRSWQNLCDDREVVNDIVEVDDQKWYVHPDWCVKDNKEN